jgi:prepilin-type processing-associated H-X9-DG protein
LIWRAKDARNDYIARYNPLEDNVRVYKVEGGERTVNIRDCGTLSQINSPNNIPSPYADPKSVAPEYQGNGCTFHIEGHCEWPEVTVHHIGMTTAWPPNKQTPGGPGYSSPDVDLNSRRERIGGPTYAAVTSRSYHPGGVNILLGDGSVRFVKSTIDGMAWRALGTVAGGEVISSDVY